MFKLEGFNVTALSIAGSVLVFALMIHFQAFWQPWQHIMVNVLYALIGITIIFAAQFSRSRFSLLAALWLVFYLSLEYTLPWSAWLKSHKDWMLLTGVGVFALFSVIKDRGLLSVHGPGRLLFIAMCGLVAHLWLWASDLILGQVPKTDPAYDYVQLLSLEVPVVLASMVLLWQSLVKANLLLSALLVSFIIWCVQYYQLIALPWEVILTVLVCHYLLVVVIDSYFLAYRDELTTLPSRRALNQLALSLGRKYTVAMLDIDHFKKFNDTYGHDIGDQVLKLVASKLSKVRGGGKVYRYGGEEFTVVFPGKSAAHAVAELEILRQSIADYKMVIRDPNRQTKQARNGSKNKGMKTVSITISIGVAMRGSKQNFDRVLKLADEALYRAKKNGRNNVSQ
ncbi:sensor domain-containing diguanylate cyclase [Thalassomonas actiniarum]|nr:diguanylate cyclase [Thalassomonas actiniarum]